MKINYGVIVIGAGAMGSAASYHLAGRGFSVLCLEQFSVGHAKGSSHGESRKIRLTFFEPELHTLARRSLELWQELQDTSGRHIVYGSGGLYLGPPTCEFLHTLRQAAELRNLPLVELDRSQIAERYPQFCIPDDYRGVLDETAGILRPERAIAAHAELAMRRGAVLQGHESVVQWNSTDNGVKVKTSRSTYNAGRLLICGGAWSNHLVQELGLNLAVTRQVSEWVWPKNPRMFDLDTCPGWGLDDGHGRWYYGFPLLDGGLGLKLAHDWKASHIDPDSIDREPTKEDEEDFRPCLRHSIPAADGPLLAMHVCMYTNSPDRQFIVDRHPDHENVFVACGFSGSGFKFSSVIGQVLADLAFEGRTDLPIDSFRVNRFH